MQMEGVMNDTTFQGNGKITYVPVVVNAKPPKQTNADLIRGMTDEELLFFLWWFADGSGKTKDQWLEWLKQEAK